MHFAFNHKCVLLPPDNRDGDLNGIKEFVQKECVKGEVESEYEGSRKLISISRELSDDPLTAKDIVSNIVSDFMTCKMAF